MEVTRLLAWMRWVTEECQKQAGEEWVRKNQKDKIKEEVGEFFDAIDNLEENEGGDISQYVLSEEKSIDEGIDLIMATVTMFHVLGFKDSEIMEGLRRVRDKLARRIKSGYYVNRKHIDHWKLWGDQNGKS